MDLVQVTSMLSGLRHATELVTIIRSAKTSLEDAERDFKLAELLSTLADVKSDAAEVKVALIEKDERIRELEREVKAKRQMFYQPPFYFSREEGGAKEGPFCQRCWEVDGLGVHLQPAARDRKCWLCRSCRSQYDGNV